MRLQQSHHLLDQEACMLHQSPSKGKPRKVFFARLIPAIIAAPPAAPEVVTALTVWEDSSEDCHLLDACRSRVTRKRIPAWLPSWNSLGTGAGLDDLHWYHRHGMGMERRRLIPDTVQDHQWRGPVLTVVMTLLSSPGQKAYSNIGLRILVQMGLQHRQGKWITDRHFLVPDDNKVCHRRTCIPEEKQYGAIELIEICYITSFLLLKWSLCVDAIYVRWNKPTTLPSQCLSRVHYTNRTLYHSSVLCSCIWLYFHHIHIYFKNWIPGFTSWIIMYF